MYHNIGLLRQKSLVLRVDHNRDLIASRTGQSLGYNPVNMRRNSFAVGDLIQEDLVVAYHVEELCTRFVPYDFQATNPELVHYYAWYATPPFFVRDRLL